MKWSPQQDKALKDVAAWLQNPSQQVYRLFGYAGTGKTTLAKHLAEGVNGDVLFGAYTGKAAHVLRSKGCSNAATIHSMIYTSREKGQARMKEIELQLSLLRQEVGDEARAAGKDAGLVLANHPRIKDLQNMLAEERKAQARPLFSKNIDSPVRGAKLVVIDECSMVDQEMGQDLLSFGAKVLVLGDPAQLPPVGGAGYFTECEPDTLLQDIHRQANDNPIIELATRVRNKDPLPLGNYGDSVVIDREALGADRAQEWALAADQILVGRNKTRHASNARMRRLLGYTADHPMEGERLVGLRNNSEKGLLNGALWDVDGIGHVERDLIYMTLSPEGGGAPVDLSAHMHHFQGRADELAWYERKEAEEFDYGYTLTVHKSQGSQWDNVLLFDESAAFNQDRHRWLYTGITRAAETVRVIRM